MSKPVSMSPVRLALVIAFSAISAILVVLAIVLVVKQLSESSKPDPVTASPMSSPVPMVDVSTRSTVTSAPTPEGSLAQAPEPIAADPPAEMPVAQSQQPASPAGPAELAVPLCPAGRMTVTLHQVTFAPGPYRTTETTYTGSGTVANSTQADVLLFDADVPDLKGLDSRGDIATIEKNGQWDWAPPQGQINPGFFILKPGQSVGYTISDTVPNSMLNEVIGWYSTAEISSFDVNFNSGEYLYCPAPLAPAGDGRTIPAVGLPLPADYATGK